MTALAELSDEDLKSVLERSGSQRAAARELGVAQSTLVESCQKRGLMPPRQSRPMSVVHNREMPSISIEEIHQGMEAPNNCRVKQFLEMLDPASKAAVERALSYERTVLTAPALRTILINKGFDPELVPGVDAINNHRNGARPCRCKG